jgi:exodeoxyribonuclease V beta subunit
MTATALNVFRCPLSGTNLIEASAGTGKTWNICGLYMRLLLERRLEVQQILVVTFTKAATAELRERIRSRIVETLARLRGSAVHAADPFVDTLLHTLRTQHGLADDDMVLRLDHALQTFDEASVFTIHGFCKRALDDTPFTAGVPMSLELLADDTELRMEVVHDFWRRHLAGGTLAPAVVDHLLECKDSPDSLARLLKRQLAKPLSRVLWPVAIDQPASIDTTALAAAHTSARRLWLQDRDAIVGCVKDALRNLNGTVYKTESVDQAAASWDALLADDDALAAPTDLVKLDLFAACRLIPKRGCSPPVPHRFFDEAETLLALRDEARQALSLERLRLLRELLASGPQALRRAKRERRVVAFDDMLCNLHERLTGGDCPWLADALRTRFPAALIDEFQDTDPLQFAIFKRIYAGSDAPLFLVGDPKQAIYSFRHADLHTYLQARDEAGAEYTLAENQRSTAALLAALNALFTANDRAFALPGLDYRPVEAGARPRKVFSDPTAPRAPLQLWALPAADDGLPLPKPRARQLSASACAAEIARLVAAGQRGEITLASQPLKAGDIAVLVRSHAQGGEMRRALAAVGVGSVELSQASVFDSADAEELARVLAAVLEPARERLLRAALSTELMGRDAAAVEAISADEAGLLDVVARFAGYRDLWLQRGVGVMLRQLMVREAVNERMLARPDGERRLTNLLHLSECLHEAAAGHADPQALLRWLRAQAAAGHGDDAAQLRLESDRNLVQIITIHRAKGLEYPVVFCPFLWDGHPGPSPRSADGREYHDESGRPVVDFRPLDKAAEDAIKERLATERAAETLRLVYVALTRAVHRCYLVVGSYTSRSRTSTTESHRGPLNWLVAGQGHTPEAWPKSKLSAGDIAGAWNALAEKAAPHVGLANLPQTAAVPVQPLRPAPDTLAALDPPAHLSTGWWIGSYSSLTHGARHEGAAVDHDLRVPAANAVGLAAATFIGDDDILPAAAAFIGDDDILNFPRGPVAGECMHAVFERIDFRQPEGWPAAVEAALRMRPQTTSGLDAAARLPTMLARMLDDVLHTPLPGGYRLADVPRERRLVELEFSLPSRHLRAGSLAAALRDNGYPVPPLSFGTLEGYLRGFIDLVFEHAGRFHVLDWKSNHLGDTPAHYGPAPMARAMNEHGYHLQALLYTVAVHRYLQRRLPDYRYDEHFGSVMYLFVRGVRPAWTTADGAPAGVHAHRPGLQVVEQISALMEPMQEPA